MTDTDDEVLLWKADFSAEQLRDYARQGIAMPDGSYPVPDADHLDKAILGVGRGTNNAHTAIRRHIIARAKALSLSSRIPDTWSADGSISKSDHVDLEIPLWKSETEHIVYGVVMTPELGDSQDDIADEAEIRKAAHRWMAESRLHDVQHSETVAAIEPVESFIAPADLEIAGKAVRKGAWVLAAHVSDAHTWERVEKGELTGWSIGGSGVRTPIAA